MSDCVFCDIAAGRVDKMPSHFADIGDSVIFEPLNPVTSGHLLVVPKRHVRNAAEDPGLTASVMRAASVLAGTWPAANIITSLGRVATQSVFHLHIHVVPRRPGDGLHLPWTGQAPAPTQQSGHICCYCPQQAPPLPCCNAGHDEAERLRIEFNQITGLEGDGDV